MEQYWIYYAIAASLCIGFYGFAQKMKAELPEQSETGFIVYSYIGMLFSGLIGGILSGTSLSSFNYESFFYAFSITMFYLVIIKTRLRSLKYLSSATYFINYRIISSLWLIIVGVVFFSETISLREGIGVFLGFFVFYLLLEKKILLNHSLTLKKDFSIYL